MAHLERSPEMTFRDYCSLMTTSVAETGYDLFHPSACVPGILQDRFHVLDGELSEEGEESLALSWARSLAKSGTVFLAFRGGRRRVTVIELKDGTLADALVFQVNPPVETSG